MNIPNVPGTTRRPPRPEAEAEELKESIDLLMRETALGKKTSSGWPLLTFMR
jgi:hypothetical protein